MKRRAMGEPEPTSRSESAGKRDPARERTQPLARIGPLVFAGYLERYQLSMLDVARAAHVRLLTVWRILHDEPIAQEQARQVYAGLLYLTGVSYRGRIRQRAAEEETRGWGRR